MATIQSVNDVTAEQGRGKPMLTIGESAVRIGKSLSRRDFLQVGGLGALGLTLRRWLAQSERPERDPVRLPASRRVFSFF